MFQERHCRDLSCFRALSSLFLVFGATASLFQGFRNALRYSQDFQWSPVHLIVSKINPYTVFLEGNVEGQIILSQAPNYMPSLYLLLLPFGFVDFEIAKTIWAALNVCMALLLPIVVCRVFGVRGFSALVIICLFAMSTPTRNAIGNGQQSLLILFLFLLPILVSSKLSFLFHAVAYSKYSFAPIFAVLFMRRYGADFVLPATLIGLLGYLLVVTATGDLRVAVLFEPLLVARQAVGPGFGDLMTVVEITFVSDEVASLLSGLVAVLVQVTIGMRIARGYDVRVSFAIASLAALITTKHLGYDWVFLLPLLAFVARWQGCAKARSGIWALVIWVWFGQKLASLMFGTQTEWWTVMSTWMTWLGGTAVLIALLRNKELVEYDLDLEATRRR